MADSLHFVHISDTHLGHLRDWIALGNNPFRNLLRVLEAINSLPTRPQFVIHTGDVANHNSEVAYELAAEAFSQINIPTYFVTGNWACLMALIYMKHCCRQESVSEAFSSVMFIGGPISTRMALPISV